MQAPTTASRTDLPAARSASIRLTRITAFSMMVPIRASSPTEATRPSGWPDGRSAATTPISPKGAGLETIARRWKLLRSNIRTVSMMTSIAGTTANAEACDWIFSSTEPSSSIRSLGAAAIARDRSRRRADRRPQPAARPPRGRFER